MIRRFMRSLQSCKAPPDLLQIQKPQSKETTAAAKRFLVTYSSHCLFSSIYTQIPAILSKYTKSMMIIQIEVTFGRVDAPCFWRVL